MTDAISLEPVPSTTGEPTLATILRRRRSTKRFAPDPVTRRQLAHVLWAAQGTTGGGHRTCPSAHARYPLAVTVVWGEGDGIASGVYRYVSDNHTLLPIATGDQRGIVATASLADQEWLSVAPVLLLISGDPAAAETDFADQPPPGRGRRYLWLEAGHASQNVYLWAAAERLGAVLVAGFDDERLSPLLPDGHDPLAVVAVGHPAG
ncbi:MAG: SagB/ThcOx family dehydrogenase [Stackebrandtia sp.]